MSSKIRVVTLTMNPAIDSNCSVERVEPEAKMRCDEPSFFPGGGGINVARAIRELGGHAIAYWTKGGALGDLLKHLLDLSRTANQALPIAGMTRENLVVTERASGCQYRFCMPGPRLLEHEAENCIAQLRSMPPADYLVLSGSLPPGVTDDFYARIARSIHSDCRVVLDTSGQALRDGLKAPIYLIKPNLKELGGLVGREVCSASDIKDISKSLIEQGRVRIVVTSLGADGAIVVTSEGAEHIPAPQVPIRSKVGAGDSAVAGIVVGLVRGLSITQAVRFGVAAGSAAVITEGTELCRRSDVERLYGEMQGDIAAPQRP